MARSEGFYERFARSVAPSIFGNLGMHESSFQFGDTDFSVRYKESNNLFAFRWIKKDASGWNAASRRHKCPLVRRSRNS